MPSIYIVNPAPSFPGYHTGEALDVRRTGEGWVQAADLTIATVAALVPAGWDIRLTDEAISPVDVDAEVDFVAITGKISQRDRMYALAREFRRRGRVVLIGGSFASLTPHDARPHADILVTGELETIADELFADLAAGRWQASYHGNKADLRSAPIPRWDLYPLHRTLFGAVQTTRGCPFNCEFCDVIQYQGRKQRFKDPAQVLAELDVLYAHGARQVFIVDDNFTVHRRHAHAMLDALAEWNGRRDEPVRFSTQASLDVARDEDLLEKCRIAGLRVLFVGIETINRESLIETGKRQNLLLPIEESLRRILAAGIAIQAGIIVGFDHDDAQSFDELARFLASSPLPDLSVGVLTAPYATDLHRRLSAAGRLVGESWETTAANPFSTNIIPERMSREELVERAGALCRSLYTPEAFQQRVLQFIKASTTRSPRVPRPCWKASRRSARGSCSGWPGTWPRAASPRPRWSRPSCGPRAASPPRWRR